MTLHVDALDYPRRSTDASRGLPERNAVRTREAARQRSAVLYGLTGLAAWAQVDPELTAIAARAQAQFPGTQFAVNIFDDARMWTIVGTPDQPAEVFPRPSALSDRVMADQELMTGVYCTSDASVEPLLANSPWVTGDLAATRAFCAVGLIGREGLPLGTVSVADETCTPLTRDQQDLLVAVRDEVMAVLDARRAPREDEVASPAVLHPVGAERHRPAVSSVASGWSIARIIDTQAVRTVFQPVVHLPSLTISGFEALSRGPVGSPLESPTALLSAAAQAGRTGEFDWLCRVQAMDAAVTADLPLGLSWLINVEPAGVALPCPDPLASEYELVRRRLRVVLEVVERDASGYVLDLLRATDDARRDSWGVALDDVGAEEASLALLPLLRPDVVKLDMSLVQKVPRGKAAAVTAAVRAYAERTGAVILAEGIETVEHEQLALVFGATFGQGYRYGRPGALPDSVPEPVASIPLRQHITPLNGRTPFEAATNGHVAPHRAAARHLEHIAAHLEEDSAGSTGSSIMLSLLPRGRQLTESMHARYRQLARSNLLTVVLGDDIEPQEDGPLHVAGLDPVNRMQPEWAVIFLNPYRGAAFVARECGVSETGERWYDYVYTHDHSAVVAAARAYLKEYAPPSEPTT